MRPIGIYAALGALLLAGRVEVSTAQDTLEDAIRDGRTCLSSGGGSRVVTHCDGEKTTVLRVESEITTEVRLSAPELSSCRADVDLEYTQWNTMAHVEGTLTNETCAASLGQYEIAVTVRGENGEVETLEFGETWQRSDDQPVILMADYPIGKNVELVRLKTQWLRCSCVDDADEPTEP